MLAKAQDVSVERDLVRLVVKEQQDELFLRAGYYEQVLRSEETETKSPEGYAITGALDIDYSIDVYSAPCGDGWTLNVYQVNPVYVNGKLTASTTNSVHSVGYGCAGLDYTFNW